MNDLKRYRQSRYLTCGEMGALIGSNDNAIRQAEWWGRDHPLTPHQRDQIEQCEAELQCGPHVVVVPKPFDFEALPLFKPLTGLRKLPVGALFLSLEYFTPSPEREAGLRADWKQFYRSHMHQRVLVTYRVIHSRGPEQLRRNLGVAIADMREANFEPLEKFL